jgi:hypothetical protein
MLSRLVTYTVSMIHIGFGTEQHFHYRRVIAISCRDESCRTILIVIQDNIDSDGF